MKTHLLSIPLKKTEEVHWAKNLNSYLVSIYGNTSEFQQDLNNFEKLRQDIRGVNADATGVILYYKYYSQLELLDLRIPFDTMNKYDKLKFCWFDAFDPSEHHEQSALPFEKASVLFNLGSILSKVAVSKYEEAQRNISSISIDESIKESLQYFQQAAGIYAFLNENFLHAPSTDLNQKTVKFLTNLMLAQSQEVFLLKVISGDVEQKKNSLIAKLSSSASTYFHECYNMVSNGIDASKSGYSVSDGEGEYSADDDILQEEVEISQFNAHWSAIVNFKVHFYKSLSFYFNGLYLESGQKYGEAIAYFNKSSDILNGVSNASLKSIVRSSSNDAYELLENYKYQKDTVAIKLNDLEKDNDFIYHEIVPSVNSIRDVKSLDSVKIIKINENSKFKEINDENYSNFLSNVIPINIHELLSYYSEEKSVFLRNEIDLVDVSNEELASTLEHLKMPMALVSLKKIIHNEREVDRQKFEIDPIFITYANEISSSYDKDTSNRGKIDDLKKQVFSIINYCESLLSNKVIESSIRMKEELIKLKKSLYEAGNSDNQLFALVSNENSYLYGIMSKGPNSPDFKQLFTKANTEMLSEEIDLLSIDDSQLGNSYNSVDKKITCIEDILHDLNKLKTSKSRTVEELKSDIHKDDISDILILNSKIKSTKEIKSVIFPEELKKFGPYNSKLDSLVERQKQLIDRLKLEWSALSSSSKVREIQNSSQFQDDMIKDQSEKLSKLYNDWRSYTEGLNKGVAFYSRLLEYTNSIKQNINFEIENSSRSPQVSLERNLNAFNLGSEKTGGSLTSVQNSYAGISYIPEKLKYLTPDQHISSYNDVPASDRGLTSRTPSNSGFGSYSRPPELPPKRPSNDQFSYSGLQNSTSQNLAMKNSTVENSSILNSSHSQQYPYNNTAKSDDLIYNQPSTYQPNMYNFFSNN